jgi:hypothetical protein
MQKGITQVPVGNTLNFGDVGVFPTGLSSYCKRCHKKALEWFSGGFFMASSFPV